MTAAAAAATGIAGGTAYKDEGLKRSSAREGLGDVSGLSRERRWRRHVLDANDIDPSHSVERVEVVNLGHYRQSS